MLNKFLGVLHRDYIDYMNKEFETFPFDKKDFPVLIAAYEYEGITINEISRISKVVKSSISSSSTKLEKLDYIVKKEDPDHKQKKKIYLTDPGKEIALLINQRRRQWEKETLDKLGKERAEIFMDIFSELYSKVSEEDK